MQKSEFKPKLGQVDYTNIRRAPVINCVVKYRDKILIVKRNQKMKFYPNLWNGISGFLDDGKTIEQKAREEIKEELGLEEKNILKIKQGKTFEIDEPRYSKTWIVHPILAEVDTDEIRLDWEARDYKWLKVNETKNLPFVLGFDDVLEILFEKEKIEDY